MPMAITSYQNIESTLNSAAEMIPFKREASIFKDLDIIEAHEEVEPEIALVASAELEKAT